MRKITNLNFEWFFKDDFNDSYLKDYSNITEFQIVNLPHSIAITPYNNFDEKKLMKETCYKRIIKIKKEMEGKVIELIFEGVAHKATIYLNDDFVVIHKGGYDEFRVNISEYVKYGEDNVLTVVVDSNEDRNIPPFGSFIDFLGYGGIYREVYLEVSDNERIADFFVRTPNVNTSITAYCDLTLTATPVEIIVTILDENKEISVNKYNVNREKETIDFDVKNKVNWSLDNPKLYGINIKMYSEKKLLDEVSGRFAFREITVNHEGFFLNGEKIQLIGLNRQQSYPYVGYAMPKSAQEKDAEILKYDLGCTIVRTANYTQSKHFLNRCDEIGLLVIDEIPGWHYIGDEEFQTLTKENVKNMILRDRNHPSIVMWSVRINGSPDNSKLYSDTNNIAHALDNTRPTFGARNFSQSETIEDVFGYNDYSYINHQKALKKIIKSQYLISEHSGHLYPTKNYDSEMQRLNQALRHLDVLNDAQGKTGVMGTIGWCMCDYNSHKGFGSNDKVCYHGVLDMFRNPKYAGLAYSSQKENEVVLEVASNLSRGDYINSDMKKIYIFTNCEYVKMFKNDNFVEAFYPDKKNYPNLAHPPIVIDDEIGQVLERQEKMSLKHSESIKRIMQTAIKKGYKIGFINRVKCWNIMHKYGHPTSYIYNLFTKYIIGEANKDIVYRFDGYSNENVVKSVTIKDIKETKLHLKADKDELKISSTYDVVRVVLEERDQDNNIIPYSVTAVHVEASGGLEVIGPKDIILQGGKTAFWLKTNQKENTGKVVVTSNNQIIEKSFLIHSEINDK